MAEKRVGKGDIIYTAGDVPDVAYILISGKVELLSINQGQQEEQVRVITPGKTFGEYALFDPQSLRPVIARALEPSILVSVSPQEFDALVLQCPKDIQPFMTMAFEKMKATKQKDKSYIKAVLETDITKLIIEPASDVMKTQFKPMEIPVARLPFRIGGYPEGGEVSRRDSLHLAISSHINPLRVSRQHCEIAIEDKEIIITDLGSRFCTEVNEVVIGRGHGAYSAHLKKGTNTVTLGAVNGPYKLVIKCD